jgi:hypothetical protein
MKTLSAAQRARIVACLVEQLGSCYLPYDRLGERLINDQPCTSGPPQPQLP